LGQPASLKPIVCPSEADLQLLGEDLALALRQGDLITLEGDLGAGKTTLSRALIRAAAKDEHLEVPSPTFTLVQSYSGFHFGTLSHMDLYRIEDPAELEELGLDDALADGAVLVEWPLKGGLTPDKATLAIEIDTDDDDTRLVSISGTADAFERVSRTLEIRQFLNENGIENYHRRHFFGDASARSYETVYQKDPDQNSILMNAPAQPDGPVIRDGKPYSQIARLAENMSAFVGIDLLLEQAGFNVPEIQAVDLDAGLLLLENLGPGSVIDDIQLPIEERYLASIEALAKMHEVDWKDEIEIEPGIVHHVPPYDREAMLIEIDLLPAWYAEHVMGRTLSDNELSDFYRIWNNLFDKMDNAEVSLVLRDFHSPNIIWCGERTGSDRIGLIDFQDAVMGPSAYDVASLVQDARVDVSPDLETKLTDHYCALRSGGFNETAFREVLAIMCAQRATKILGIFVRLSKRDNKHAYLDHLPRIENYLKRACSHPSLAELRLWVETVL